MSTETLIEGVGLGINLEDGVGFAIEGVGLMIGGGCSDISVEKI